jgi:hypothetical protein
MRAAVKQLFARASDDIASQLAGGREGRSIVLQQLQ